MRNLGLVAFGVTTCVLVPTLLHVLEAGPNQVAKLVAPGARSIAFGNTKVDISVDRAFVDPGAKIHLTLAATGDAKRVKVAVVVLESTGSSGGRVETAPASIAREDVTLEAGGTAANATKTLAFTLRGNRAYNMDGLSPFGHYTVLVMQPKDADTFERLRRRAEGVTNPMGNDPGGRNQSFETVYYQINAQTEVGSAAAAATPDPDAETFGAPGTIARLDIATRPSGSPISIEAADTALAGYDLPVTVHVKNPSKHAVAAATITLSAKPYGFDGEYVGIDEAQVTFDVTQQTIALAPHETKDVVFHLMTKTTGTLGLYARGSCDDEDCYKSGGQALVDSALDAVDIVSGEAKPSVAAK